MEPKTITKKYIFNHLTDIATGEKAEVELTGTPMEILIAELNMYSVRLSARKAAREIRRMFKGDPTDV